MISPVLIGAVTAYLYNRPVSRSISATILVAFQLMFVVGAGLLLLAFEGVICLIMALPIVAALTLIGALIGKAIAGMSPSFDRRNYPLMLVLPIFALLEPHITVRPLSEVATTIEIDAPPETVWRNVVTFSELPEAKEWYFKLGIACPERATIVGQGVGAVRYCIFSTGEFVEPITAWDAPHRLAFDVAGQPIPMTELSPYRTVYAPHLHGTFASRRGEFKLIELPGGRTRLEGRTWYDLEMSPHAYWTILSDALVHRIHLRVLEHIRQLSEKEAHPV